MWFKNSSGFLAPSVLLFLKKVQKYYFQGQCMGDWWNIISLQA